MTIGKSDEPKPAVGDGADVVHQRLDRLGDARGSSRGVCGGKRAGAMGGVRWGGCGWRAMGWVGNLLSLDY